MTKLTEVPAVRVRHWNYKTDEREDGTVIGESNNYYLVIPDYNLSIERHWKKENCDILR